LVVTLRTIDQLTGLYSGKRQNRASSRLIHRFTLNLLSTRSILLASTRRLTRSTPAPIHLAIRSIVIHPPTLSSPRWIRSRRPLLRRRHPSRIANSSTFGPQSQVQRHREGDGVRVVLWRYMSIWLGRSSLNCGGYHSMRNPTTVRLPFKLSYLYLNTETHMWNHRQDPGGVPCRCQRCRSIEVTDRGRWSLPLESALHCTRVEGTDRICAGRLD